MDNSNLNICSLNARGLRNRIKRKTIFKKLKDKNMHIIAFQETYLSDAYLDKIKKELNGTIHFSPCKGKSGGLFTFFSNSLGKENISILHRSDRIIISKIPFNDYFLYIINTYAPCLDSEKILFLKRLEQLIQKMINSDEIIKENIVCLGDFNIVANNSLDIISGNPHSDRTVDQFSNFRNNLLIHDIWRVSNPNEKTFTWSKSKNGSASARRLDYILCGTTILNLPVSADIETIGFTDHRLVTLQINITKQKRGPGIYKINTNLFRDHNYVNLIIDTIEKTKIEYKNLNANLLWEMIKITVRDKSQQYSKSRDKEKRDESLKMEADLKELERKFSNNMNDTTIINKISNLQKNIEIQLIEKTKASSIRAGIKWIQEGEKNNKYFLGLEKSKYNANTIFQLKSSNNNNPAVSISKPEDILNEIRDYYQALYKDEKNIHSNIQRQNDFMQNLKLPQLKETDKESLENEILVSEVLASLKNLKNGSSPGSDSIPTEFYKFFWPQIKEPLTNSIQYASKTQKLCLSQRKGILTLIHKGKDLDKNDLKNWRPISLMNCDYKILAKVLARRLQNCTQYLVHHNQSGFIKGRNISQTIREIDDIIENQKHHKLTNILLTIDFEKAFDTISSTFIIEMCRCFGFGENIMKWIETIMSDRYACVKNNGYISSEFKLQRGIRQGCPLSPLLFVLAVELLALKIRQEKSIKGIKVVDTFTKIRQYADDTTFLLKDAIDFREVLSRLKEFTVFSGLKINKTKSKAICPGNRNLYGMSLHGIEMCEEIKLLGVYFSSEEITANINKNWEPRLIKTESILRNWTRRDLTIIGKVLVLKTFALSNFVHLMQSIGMPEIICHKLNTLFFKFLWKKKLVN